MHDIDSLNKCKERIVKKYIALFALILIQSCSSGDDSTDSSQLNLDVSNIPPTEQMLASRSTCMSCHQLTAKTLGPSIEDISMKHKNTDINRLVAIVKAGRQPGELTWGNTPMPPSFLPEEEIKKVIEWMLRQ